MSFTATKDSQPFCRTVKKVATAVTSPPQIRQSWGKEHTGKQDPNSSTWLSDFINEEEKEKEKISVKLTVTPHVNTVNNGNTRECKNTTVIKPITPKSSKCSPDLVSSINEKNHNKQMAPEEPRKIGNESPSSKCHCGGKAKTLGQREERKIGLRSSSSETEDSGLGEDAALSDNSDQSKVKQKKLIIRPKVKVTTMGDLKNKWQKFAEEHVEGQKLNPFSEDFDYGHAMTMRLHKGEAGYGRPKEGSRTAQRADRAQKHIHREMEEMCFIIRDMGEIDKEGRIFVTFRQLFDHYIRISDKVVGILLRCRKHKMVDFEGEMLWQGQDDNVKITLLV
ncbi:actin-binding Rho-activating protein [Trichomycterus rosablanca]|uniref:actin-binding Rho-activating protein n=1 Tax=Trichomycterus rosablanca TaxID=2290929 RepID=UPI002F35427D